MEIKNVTRVDEMMYVKLQHFAMRIFKKHDILNYIFWGIIGFITLVYSAVSLFLFFISAENIDFPYLGLFNCVLLMGLYTIYYFILPRQMYKASTLFGGTESYVFTDSEIINETNSKKISSRAVFGYDTIVKVWEKPDVIYIYVSRNQVLLVSKYGFETLEGLDTVREKLRASVPAKKYRTTK